MSETRLPAEPAFPTAAIDLAHRRVRVSAPPEGRVLQIQARRGAVLDAARLGVLAAGDGDALREFAPGQWAVVADAPIGSAEVAAAAAALAEVAHVFDIGPGRVRLRLDGADVVDHLAAHVVVDLTLRAFPVGRTVATLCGHVSVWLTRLGDTAFEIVAPRSFAADLHGELTGHP